MSPFVANDRNAACASVGPLGPVHPEYAITQLVVFSFASGYVFVFTMLLVLVRRANPLSPLAKRSLLPLIINCGGSIFIIMTRSYYDFVGREYFSCTFSTILIYLAIPLVAINDVISFQAYVYQLKRREYLKFTTAESMTEEVDEGLWKQFLSYLKVVFFVGYTDTSNSHLPLHIPPKRLLFFEINAWLLLSSLMVLAGVVRVTTEPVYVLENGCVGCRLEQTDFIILVVATIVALPQLIFNWLKTRNQDDPMGVIMMGVSVGVIGAICGCSAVGLAVWDPGNIMQNQYFDWFDIELCMYIILFTLRVPIPMFKYVYQHYRRLALEEIRLEYCLHDTTACSMIEKALASELASENYEFWRRVSKWKAEYKEDSSKTRQDALFLISSFVGLDATFPVNISYVCAQNIFKLGGGEVTMSFRDKLKSVANSFRLSKHGVNDLPSIPPFIFDQAVREVLDVIEYGAFYRVKMSPEFKKWASNSDALVVPSDKMKEQA